MGKLHETVKAFMLDDDWHYESDEERFVIRCAIKCRNATFRIIMDSEEEMERFRVFIMCPNFIPEEHRFRLCEFINRANYGLRMGNFEMDMKDGEVRFRLSIDVEGGELTHMMIKNMIRSGYSLMDKYYPGIMAILYGGLAPAAAIEQIETPQPSGSSDDPGSSESSGSSGTSGTSGSSETGNTSSSEKGRSSSKSSLPIIMTPDSSGGGKPH
ncbi:MAG: hypothetical protein CVV64_17190 [Candidatus Wallbacteria bacterium HGW-Wallbacteria-1]|jgi:hypothetical protein|uniref:YbjN domain-containing protein n=1 Tax=Candidatus Wallbacteria bacterium HGW-Wallbacteria-1 TaxID=2013854 RepID=A0A2N1PKE0_9BACT|nr:MAG: hypothetical protein CVV64_17190 [Candidatus Wallbacteria bacterium HGW-Wallbacteria-1]